MAIADVLSLSLPLCARMRTGAGGPVAAYPSVPAGAVGAAPGVRHPAAAAARIAEESRAPLPLGLVRPM
jgi:hypothetical protein